MIKPARDDTEEADIGESTPSLDSATQINKSTKIRASGAGPVSLRRLSIWRSPSSPNIKAEHDIVGSPASPTGLTRSKTLPRTPGLGAVPGELVLGHELIVKLRRWILALVIGAYAVSTSRLSCSHHMSNVVEFDLDLGPTVRCVCPSAPFTAVEAQNIAFSSFPDSLQFEEGSQAHSFRMRDCRETIAKASDKPHEMRPASRDGFIYGFAHFTQRREETAERGYRQRSLVLLTHHPYPSLFLAAMSVVGPVYEIHGGAILELVCCDVGNWPDPVFGETVELALLGSILHAELPHTIDSQQLTETSSFGEKYDPRRHILALSAPLSPPPLLLFEASLTHLWSLWECLVLCEPVLVFGPSPALTSQAVWWLRDLLRPIPLHGDIRPYFTIHDQDHSVLVNKLPPKTGLLLGVTNPVFEKLCMHWPHTLSLGRSSKNLGSYVGPPPGWKSQTHTRYISKNRELLSQLERACTQGEQIQIETSMRLRRHFCSRTTALLVPLHRYLTTLMPSQAEYAESATRRALPLKPFNTANFLASLKTDGSPLPFRSTKKRVEFYKRWLKTPAFGLWLANQEEVVHHVLQQTSRS